MIARIKHIYLVYLLMLLSGALQRPMGGGVVQGTLTSTLVQGSNTAFKALLITTLGLGLIVLLAGLRRVRLPRASGFALAFNMIALASALWSPLPMRTLQDAVGLGFATMVAITAVSFYDWAQMRRALVQVTTALVGVTAVLALLAPSYAFHGTSEFYSIHAGLLRGSYVHKNDLAVMLGIALVTIICLGRPMLEMWLWAPLVLGTGYMIVLTGAAKALISVPIALAIGTLMGRKRGSGMLVLGGTIAAMICASIVLTGYTEAVLDSLSRALGRDTTLSGRTMIWDTAIDYTLRSQNWLAGGGFGAAWSAGIGAYSQQQLGVNAGHPHNGYIAVFNDLGVLGLVLICAAMVRALSCIVRAPIGAARRYALSLFLLIAITDMAGTALPVPVSITWCLFMLLGALANWDRRDA